MSDEKITLKGPLETDATEETPEEESTPAPTPTTAASASSGSGSGESPAPAPPAARNSGAPLDYDAVWRAVAATGVGSAAGGTVTATVSEEALVAAGVAPRSTRVAEFGCSEAAERFGATMHGDADLAVDRFVTFKASGSGGSKGRKMTKKMNKKMKALEEARGKEMEEGADEGSSSTASSAAQWTSLEEAAAYAYLLLASREGGSFEVDDSLISSPWKDVVDWDEIVEKFSWDVDELLPGVILGADRGKPPHRTAILEDDGNYRCIVAQCSSDLNVFYLFEFWTS